MRVTLFQSDYGAIGHYRMRFVADALRTESDLDIVIVPPGESAGLSCEFVGDRVLRVWGLETDVVVFQRPTTAVLAQAVPLLRAQGIAVVVDMDDDLSRIHPANPSYTSLNPQYNKRQNWSWAAQACHDATLVTMSTLPLAKVYGAHGRVRVLRNRIPSSYLSVRPGDRVRDPRFAWPGLLATHPEDLDVAAPAIRRLIGDGHEFGVIGNPKGVGRALGMDLDPPGTGEVKFSAWLPALQNADVGIAPLVDTPFNRAKSGLKVLELSAAGVPCVASDLPEYRMLADEGAGIVVGSKDSWYPTLKLLLTKDRYRADAGERAREVAARHTYEQHAHEWASAWESAWELQRGLVSA